MAVSSRTRTFDGFIPPPFILNSRARRPSLVRYR
jgi:hypothetical protein